MGISAEFQNRFKDITDEMDENSKINKAKIIGISNVTFSNAYNYGILPKTSSLIRIANHFNISVTYLLAKTDNEYFVKASTPKHFTERLEELKNERNIKTIYELAKSVHIHRNNIAQWNKNNFIPLIDDVEIIADFFNVSIDYLLGRTDDRTPY